MCICTSKHLYLHCFVFGTAVCINTIDSLFTYSKTQNNKEKKKQQTKTKSQIEPHIKVNTPTCSQTPIFK